MGQYEGMSEDDARDPGAARIRDKKKKKLHLHLMKQMRELYGWESNSELDAIEDISVPTAPRTRTKKMKLEVKPVQKNGQRKRKKRKKKVNCFLLLGWCWIVIFIPLSYSAKRFFALGVS